MTRHRCPGDDCGICERAIDRAEAERDNPERDERAEWAGVDVLREGGVVSEEMWPCGCAPLRHSPRAQQEIDRLAAERDQARGIAVALEQQVAAAIRYHFPDDSADWCHNDGYRWPCPTRRALDGEP